MNHSLEDKAKTYINVMEDLVDQEIKKQLEFYPKNLKNYINEIEVATYALNRLPSLYASSILGKEKQKRIANKQYQSQIHLAVRQAFAAIQRDPLRKSNPILCEKMVQNEQAKTMLKKSEIILKKSGVISPYQNLSWDNLYRVIRGLLT
ncbi:MAG: late competence development ComFB family protein [Crocosphaera sp.]|nr:late competence development ComFB family protein [Crocosphaera sp.]